jgi:hypothetical protein
MKTKMIFSTETFYLERWLDLTVVPRVKEWLRVSDFIEKTDFILLKSNALCWSGDKGLIDVVEHRRNEKGDYVELMVWCED